MLARGKRKRGTSPSDEPQASSSAKVTKSDDNIATTSLLSPTDAAYITTVLASLLSENQNLNKRIDSLLASQSNRHTIQSKVNEKLQREVENLKSLLAQNNKINTPVAPQQLSTPGKKKVQKVKSHSSGDDTSSGSDGERNTKTVTHSKKKKLV